LNLLSAMVLVTCVHAIYFNLEDGQNRCFLEEVPKDTLILGRFKADISALPGGPAVPGFQFAGRPFGGIGAQQIQQQAPPGVGIKVTVTDPSGNLALQRDLPSEGRFALTSQMGGEFKICVQTNTSARWFGSKQKLKLHLDIETGESATDYEDIAKQEHLSVLEIEVRKLNDRLRDVRAEQNYQRNREVAFRDTSESTNSRVMWWSIIQTSILVCAGMWQIFHLKSFFKSKKLV